MNTADLTNKLNAAQALLDEVRDALTADSPPAAPVEPPPSEPAPASLPLPAPSLTDNGDGTVTIGALAGAHVAVWQFEPQTDGWTGGSFVGAATPVVTALTGRIKAAYFRLGAGGDILEQGPDSILER